MFVFYFEYSRKVCSTFCHLIRDHIRTVCPTIAHTNLSIDLPLIFFMCLPLSLFVFLSLCLTSFIIRCIYFIGTRHAAVPALRFPLGHGGTARPSRRDALRAGTPLWPVPVSLPVHQGTSAVQTTRQVQVLQYSALGDGI